jgi:hypothetical protein
MSDRYALNTQIAARLFGLQRGYCAGDEGGGSMHSQGSTYYFYCRYCGARIANGQAGPCPRWPWPDYAGGVELAQVIAHAALRLEQPLVLLPVVRREDIWFQACFGQSKIPVRGPEVFPARVVTGRTVAEAICLAVLQSLDTEVRA